MLHPRRLASTGWRRAGPCRPARAASRWVAPCSPRPRWRERSDRAAIRVRVCRPHRPLRLPFPRIFPRSPSQQDPPRSTRSTRSSITRRPPRHPTAASAASGRPPGPPPGQGPHRAKGPVAGSSGRAQHGHLVRARRTMLLARVSRSGCVRAGGLLLHGVAARFVEMSPWASVRRAAHPRLHRCPGRAGGSSVAWGCCAICRKWVSTSLT